jgi:hypothetical protein
METLLQDIRYGLRTLRKSPAFTAVAVITLALGIGATTSIFSVIEAVVLRSLPYRNSGQIVLLADAQHPEDGDFLYEDLEALKVENHTLEDVALYYRDSGFSRVTLFIAGEPELAQGAFASSNLFSLMGVPPILGRAFSAEEETRGEHVVVLSHALWISRFGASPDVIGKMLQIDGVSAQIIGGMPEQFQFPARDQLFWAPITTNRYWRDPALSSIDPGHSPGFYQRWQAVGRLKPRIQLAQAQAEVKTIFSRRRLADSNPNRGGDIDLLPLRVNLGGNTKLALGARPRQVVMLIVRDGAKLSVVGLVIGVTGSAVMTRFLRSLLFGIGPMDPVTLAGVSILLGIVALLACYIPARRAAKVDPMVALRYE